MVMELLQRVAQLAGVLEGVSGALSDSAGFCREVSARTADILRLTGEYGVSANASERIVRIGQIARALSEEARRQKQSAEQLAPVAEALMRDAGEIRRLLSALVSEGTAATLP